MTRKVTITVDHHRDDGEIDRVVFDGSGGYIIGSMEPGCAPGVTYGGNLVAVFAAITCSMCESLNPAEMDLVEAIAHSMVRHQGDSL